MKQIYRSERANKWTIVAEEKGTIAKTTVEKKTIFKSMIKKIHNQTDKTGKKLYKGKIEKKNEGKIKDIKIKKEKSMK